MALSAGGRAEPVVVPLRLEDGPAVVAGSRRPIDRWSREALVALNRAKPLVAVSGRVFGPTIVATALLRCENVVTKAVLTVCRAERPGRLRAPALECASALRALVLPVFLLLPPLKTGFSGPFPRFRGLRLSERRVMAVVIACLEHFQIADVVIGPVMVLVVDVMPFRNRPVVLFPLIPVEEHLGVALAVTAHPVFVGAKPPRYAVVPHADHISSPSFNAPAAFQPSVVRIGWSSVHVKLIAP